MSDVLADLPVRLPVDTTHLTADLAERIPKIVIGNPGAQDRLGWDVIPNWRPRLAPGVRIGPDDTVVAPGSAAFGVPSAFGTALRLCDGRTFWELCTAFHAATAAVDLATAVDLAAATDDAAQYVKAGRVLGIVKWDFVLRNEDGAFFRRRPLGGGPTGHDWFFVPAFTKDVFDLCSGAYSCREIAAELADRTGRDRERLLRAVLRSCRTLIDIGVVGWVDDTELRAARRSALAGRFTETRGATVWTQS